MTETTCEPSSTSIAAGHTARAGTSSMNTSAFHGSVFTVSAPTCGPIAICAPHQPSIPPAAATSTITSHRGMRRRSANHRTGKLYALTDRRVQRRDLRGAQRAVVDAEVIDQPREVGVGGV